SDVVIASGEIGFPLADDIDLLIVLSGEAYSRYEPELSSEGRLVVDSRCAPSDLNGDARQFAIVDTARAISGSQVVTGVVALGVIQALEDVVEADALREAVAARVPPKHREMNLEALQAGRELVGGGKA
ncbi:hypothetical protein MNBD_ACTINO01-842, partial [hydrothermal vent metagenome]